ncbi:hypothetical protein [Streptomyces sp. NPDC059970]|uniref:hypothetical protein n=1 Tax=Streptomyces sp. NPDC059970 TaxID=3347019 RepID=UPI003681709F
MRAAGQCTLSTTDRDGRIIVDEAQEPARTLADLAAKEAAALDEGRLAVIVPDARPERSLRGTDAGDATAGHRA